MPPFKIEGRSSKPDVKGSVRLSIQLLDPKTKNPVMANRKEEIILKDTTVGEVTDWLNGILSSNAAPGE